MTTHNAEDVRVDPRSTDFFPHYFSTYCIHGLHKDCRLTCKTCDLPCRCECHAHLDGSESEAEAKWRALSPDERRRRAQQHLDGGSDG